MENNLPEIIKQDWSLIQKNDLQKYTFARIGLEKTGHSITLSSILEFRAAHAAAKDALFKAFQVPEITEKLKELEIPFTEVYSATLDKGEYLKRPDLGRVLNAESISTLNNEIKNCDITIVVSDGLSAQAVNEHTIPLLKLLHPKLTEAGLKISPIILAHRGRVALSDPIGQLLQAKLIIILIGERPGLSSPDSMSAYITYAPKIGLTDENRNCVSNIRPVGLGYIPASKKIFYLITESLRRGISGVNLKDEMGLLGNV